MQENSTKMALNWEQILLSYPDPNISAPTCHPQERLPPRDRHASKGPTCCPSDIKLDFESQQDLESIGLGIG